MARSNNAQTLGRFNARLAVMLAAAGALSGCSVLPGACDGFGPSASASMALPKSASVDDAFTCVEQATQRDGDHPAYASKGLALRDVDNGVLETAQYQSKNVSGFRLRAEVSKAQPSTLTLSLRGAGAYCADLGVEREMARLKSDVASCLQR